MVALAAVPNVAIVYIIDCYRNRTANAMMVLNFSRNCIGAGFIFATMPVVQRIGVQKVQKPRVFSAYGSCSFWQLYSKLSFFSPQSHCTYSGNEFGNGQVSHIWKMKR
jgi:hypothetical protein